MSKQKDKQFRPKPASKVVNDDGTPMVVYHGTSDTFWAFDENEISDHEGSFFFAQNIDDAAAYSGNGRIMPVYVNLQNPVDYNDMPLELYKLKNKKAQVEALKKLGYDGWIADMDTGWGEVSAFYPEQIKSADSNKGTFDSGSPDIRYSVREYTYEALTAKPDMRVTKVDDRASYRPTREARKEIVARAITNAKKIGRTNENGNAVVRVADTGDEVILSAKGLRHGLDRRLNENAPVTLMAGEILQNSIRINELTPQHPDADGSYVLLGVGETEQGTLYLVRSVVNKYSNALSSMDVLYAVSAKKENRLRSMRQEFQHSVTDSAISIRSLLDYVNRYFPDVLPESVLRHYNHDRRPEGKLGESALYQQRDNTRTERDILADATDGDANTVREMEMLREYKEKLGRYTALTQRLEQQRELAQTAENKDERLRAKNRADNLGSLRRLDSCRALAYAPPLLDHGGQPLYPTAQKVPGAERRGLPGDATSNGWYVRRCYTS